MQIYSNKVFENPIEIVDVRGDLEAGIRRVEELRKKYFLLGYITYDFKGMYFEAFEGFKEYTPKPPKALGTIIKPKISKSEYVSAVSKIKDYIREGITYEVNYTYPSDVYTSLDGIDLYEALLEKQRTPYNTFFQNKYTYHAGGAVVWDSEAEDEWNETRVKTRFLETDFDLVETAVDDWKRHIERMKNSAEKLGFRWNNEIDGFEKFDRILLHKDGRYEVQNRDFTPIENRLIRIGRRVNSNNRFLYHKTTIRDNPPEGLFDEIGINERGEITEGTFTNIAIEKDGELFTPPVECGLLNGTFRQKLIDEGKLKERIMYPEDLEKAERIFCFNSVRKMVEVRLCSS